MPSFRPVHLLLLVAASGLVWLLPGLPRNLPVFEPVLAVLLPALVLCPRRHWGWLALTALGVDLTFRLGWAGRDPLLATARSLASLSQAVLLATWVGAGLREQTSRQRGFIWLAVVLGPATSLAPGVPLAILDGATNCVDFAACCLGESLARVLGVLSGFCVLCLFLPDTVPRRQHRPGKLEAGLLAIALTGALIVVFTARAGSPFARPSVVAALALWASVRFGVRGAALASLAVTVAALSLGLGRTGPYALPARPMVQQLLSLQLFLALQGVLFPILGLLITGQQQTEQRLREALRFSDAIFAHSPVAIHVFDRNGLSLRMNEANRVFNGFPSVGYAVGEFNVLTDPLTVANGTAERFRRAYAGEIVFVEDVRLDNDRPENRWDLDYHEAFYSQIIFPVRDETGQVSAVVSFMVDLTARHRAKEALRASLREKETLLQEVHHRVKNNLATIIGLLELQRGKVTDPATAELLHQSQNRVRAMAMLHEMLYQSHDLSSINLADYVEQLARFLLAGYENGLGSINLKTDLEPAVLDLDTAIPLGLILNELISNALKHAFVGRAEGGKIEVSFTRQGEQGVLSVRDDGIGLPADLEQRREGSLGLRLIHTLARQLGGTLTVRSEGSATFTLTFPFPSAR